MERSLNRLDKLSLVLRSIRRTIADIIAQAIPIMKSMRDIHGELVEELMEEYEKETSQSLSAEEAVSTLQRVCLELVSDSETILQEIDDFSNAIVQGEKSLEQNHEKYQFLFQVWCGDVYDETEYEGLKALEEDLQKQLAEMNEENIVQRSLSSLV
jgi:hypothetical protein